MKRNILLGTVLSLAVSLPAFADMPAAAQSETPQHKEAMTNCEKKAKKHKISEEEMIEEHPLEYEQLMREEERRRRKEVS